MKPQKIFGICIDIMAICLFVYLILFPKDATVPTRDAIMFCAKTLIPSLFIYMVLSKIIITLPITDNLAKKLGYEALLLVAGTLCGSPVGAKNALSLYETGRVSKKRAEYLCSFTNNASISFVVGFVGSELLKDTSIGLRLLAFQITASVITAVVMKYYIFGRKKFEQPKYAKTVKIGLREAISDSASTMITLCACVVFFIVCGNAIIRLFDIMPPFDALVKSVLEFSSGCAAAVKSEKYSLPLIAFAIGFTGLSVMLQVKSVIENKLSVKPFLVGKMISGSVMTLLAVIFG